MLVWLLFMKLAPLACVRFSHVFIEISSWWKSFIAFYIFFMLPQTRFVGCDYSSWTFLFLSWRDLWMSPLNCLKLHKSLWTVRGFLLRWIFFTWNAQGLPLRASWKSWSLNASQKACKVPTRNLKTNYRENYLKLKVRDEFNSSSKPSNRMRTISCRNYRFDCSFKWHCGNIISWNAWRE